MAPKVFVDQVHEIVDENRNTNSNTGFTTFFDQYWRHRRIELDDERFRIASLEIEALIWATNSFHNQNNSDSLDTIPSSNTKHSSGKKSSKSRIRALLYKPVHFAKRSTKLFTKPKHFKTKYQCR